MERDIALMKLSDIIQFVEETTGEERITQMEGFTPVPFTDDIYVTGFRVDTIVPQFHLKTITRIDMLTAHKSQKEYHLMNPDAEIWLGCDIIDAHELNDIIGQIKKKIFTATDIRTLHIEYDEKDRHNGITHHVRRDITFFNQRIAVKEAMNLRRQHSMTKFSFTKSSDQRKLKQLSDLEFATAPLGEEVMAT